MAFKFEDLIVWKKALELASEIDLLARTFPDNEKYGLASQIKRASDSIALNIAEGSTGQSNKEFARFLGMAQRSAIEVIACLHLAKARSIIDQDRFEKHYQATEKLIIQIQALKKKIKPAEK
jgi:four helix bundle protein